MSSPSIVSEFLTSDASVLTLNSKEKDRLSSYLYANVDAINGVSVDDKMSKILGAFDRLFRSVWSGDPFSRMVAVLTILLLGLAVAMCALFVARGAWLALQITIMAKNGQIGALMDKDQMFPSHMFLKSFVLFGIIVTILALTFFLKWSLASVIVTKQE
jgi:hypothetical protein